MVQPQEEHEISACAGHEAEQYLQAVEECLVPECFNGLLLAVATDPRKCAKQPNDFQEPHDLEEERGGVDGLARDAQHNRGPLDAHNKQIQDDERRI